MMSVTEIYLGPLNSIQDCLICLVTLYSRQVIHCHLDSPVQPHRKVCRITSQSRHYCKGSFASNVRFVSGILEQPVLLCTLLRMLIVIDELVI
jgi:hypothetical protein